MIEFAPSAVASSCKSDFLVVSFPIWTTPPFWADVIPVTVAAPLPVLFTSVIECSPVAETEAAVTPFAPEPFTSIWPPLAEFKALVATSTPFTLTVESAPSALVSPFKWTWELAVFPILIFPCSLAVVTPETVIEPAWFVSLTFTVPFLEADKLETSTEVVPARLTLPVSVAVTVPRCMDAPTTLTTLSGFLDSISLAWISVVVALPIFIVEPFSAFVFSPTVIDPVVKWLTDTEEPWFAAIEVTEADVCPSIVTWPEFSADTDWTDVARPPIWIVPPSAFVVPVTVVLAAFAWLTETVDPETLAAILATVAPPVPEVTSSLPWVFASRSPVDTVVPLILTPPSASDSPDTVVLPVTVVLTVFSLPKSTFPVPFALTALVTVTLPDPDWFTEIEVSAAELKLSKVAPWAASNVTDPLLATTLPVAKVPWVSIVTPGVAWDPWVISPTVTFFELVLVNVKTPELPVTIRSRWAASSPSWGPVNFTVVSDWVTKSLATKLPP